MQCPDCGLILIPGGGRCYYCPCCGWSMCDIGGEVIDKEKEVIKPTEKSTSVQE